MSAYFIIDGTYYSAQAGREIYFDNGLSISVVPQKRVMKFGDGYSLSVPIAPVLRSFTGTFSNREIEEIQVLETYFNLLGGNLVPDLTINGEVVRAKVGQISKSFQNGQAFSMSAEFKEEFR